MSTVAKKVIMGSGAVGEPSDDDFNTVGFLSHFDGANNGVNNVFDDGSTSNHTITAAGGVPQGSFSPFSRPDGEWGVSFDGSDWVYATESAADEFTFGTGNFTVEGFINHKTISGTRAIITTAQSTDFQGFWFGIVSGNYYLIYNRAAGNNWDIIVNAGSSVLKAGVWTHFAIVRNGTSNVVYINGSSIGSTTETARTLANSNNLIAIGGRNTSGPQFSISTISNVRVVKGTAVYTGNFTSPTQSLTAITNTKLLTCQSNRFVDNSASPLTMAAFGNPEVTAFSPILTSEVYDSAVNGASAFFSGSQVLSLDASGDSDSDFYFGTGDITVEGWLYLSQNDATWRWFYGAGDMWQMYVRSSIIDVYLAYGQGSYSSRVLTGSIACIAGQWHHWAVTREGGAFSFFLDGVRGLTSTGVTGSFEAPSGGTWRNDINIGDANNDGGDGGGYPFLGYMSDIRVLKGTALYDPTSSTCTVPTAPLTAITNTKLLLNMANAQAFDSAAQNNMTLLGNAKISTAQEKIGNSSLYLDGNGDYLTFPKNPANDIDGGTDWTVEFYFRPTQAAIDATLLQIVTKEAGFQIYMQNSEMGLAVSANNSGTYFVSAVTGTDLSADTWYHIAAVHYGNTYKMYVDGTVTAINTTSSSSVVTGAKWEIGGYVNGQSPTQGYIDEFRISKIARYTSNFTPDTEPFPDKGQ